MRIERKAISRWFFYRKEVLKTTWRARALALAVVVVGLIVTYPDWLELIAASLVYHGDVETSDVVVLEHYDPDYLVFETAARLRRDGLSDSVMVPCQTLGGPRRLNEVSRRIAEVMVGVARLEPVDMVPVTMEEPYTLNVVRQVAVVLKQRGIRSVIVVSPAFRSRRSYLVYASVLGPLDIRVYCVPTVGKVTLENWWKSWHGVQTVALEFAKLQYYRFLVL